MRLLSTSTEIHDTLTRLLPKHDSYSVAVAWATMDFAAQRLLVRNKAKIRRLVVGIDSYITHPDFLCGFVETPSVRWMPQRSVTFHPKVYLLESGDSWDCIVGSANFTKRGMLVNDEVALHFSNQDTKADSVRQDLQKLIGGYWAAAESFDADDVSEYRTAWEARKRDHERLSRPLVTTSPAIRRKRERAREEGVTDILGMSWAEYFKRIQAERAENMFEDRLLLLEDARSLFHDTPRLRDMDKASRTRIAGTTYERYDPDEDAFDWMWFGAMRRAFNFRSLIGRNSRGLSHALDAIPLTGEVRREHYETFRARFAKTFANEQLGGGLGRGSATRLLCMRRPDWFVCIALPNADLCKATGVPKDIGLDKYWDRLIVPLTQTPWWMSEEPESPVEKRTWMGRMAMLDAIYYVP